MPNWRNVFGNGGLLHMREAAESYPNAARLLADCVFVGHAGVDHQAIDSDLVSPILSKRKGPNGYFLHSSRSGGAEAYKHIVLIALHFCRYAIIVVSKNSRDHPWVAAEVDWLLDHRRPILIYALDNTPQSAVHPGLRARWTRLLWIKRFDRSQRDALVRWIDRIDPDGAMSARSNRWT
jgi:hypothetical protein